jgi:hypothetical protein
MSTKIMFASSLVVGSVCLSVWADDCGTAASAPSCSACPTTVATASEPAEAKPMNWVAYGNPMTLPEEKTIKAEAVLADPTAYDGKNVRMIGTVTSVCTSKGCWLKMSSDGAVMPIFVKFTCPVEGKLIPTEAKGQPVQVEGKLMVVEVSEEEAQHIAGEEGLSADAIDAIKGPQKRIEIQGPSALIAFPADTSRASAD